MLLVKQNVLKNYVNNKYLTTAVVAVGVMNAQLAVASTEAQSASGASGTLVDPSPVGAVFTGSAASYMTVTNLILLIVALIVLLVLAQVIKSIRLNPVGRRNKRLKVLDQVLIGNKQRLALIEVDGEAVLIGITPNQISFLNKTGDFNGGSNISAPMRSKKQTMKPTIEDENWTPMSVSVEDDPDIVTRQRIKLRPVDPSGSRQEPRL